MRASFENSLMSIPIQQNFINSAILDAAAFHILPADIQNGGDIRKEVAGAAVVRHGFDFSCIRPDSLTDEFLSIAGDAGTADISSGGKFII